MLVDINQSQWDSHAGIAELYLYHLQDLNYFTPSHLGFLYVLSGDYKTHIATCI